MQTDLHICQTEGTEGHFLMSGAGMSNHGSKNGVGLSLICFLYCGDGGGPRFSKKGPLKSACWILPCTSLDPLKNYGPLKIYGPFPKIHVSIGNHLFIKQGKNKKENKIGAMNIPCSPVSFMCMQSQIILLPHVLKWHADL